MRVLIAVLFLTLSMKAYSQPTPAGQPNKQAVQQANKPADSAKQESTPQPPAPTASVAIRDAVQPVGDQNAADQQPNKNEGWWDRLWSDPTATFTGLLFVVTFLLWLATCKLVMDAGKNSNRQLRAYVFPESAGIWDGATCTPPQEENINRPMVSMVIKNSGQSPAHNVRIGSKIFIIEPSKGAGLGELIPEDAYSSPIGPGATMTHRAIHPTVMTAEEITGINSGTLALYLIGRIEYRDVFKNKRFTNFRVAYMGAYPPPGGNGLSFTEKGNDADQE